MKALIYEKFGAVLQMQCFVCDDAAAAVFGVKCVVYGLNDLNCKTLCSPETHNTVNFKH